MIGVKRLSRQLKKMKMNKEIKRIDVAVLIFITVGSTIGLLIAVYKEYGEICVYIMLFLAVPYYLLNRVDFK